MKAKKKELDVDFIGGARPLTKGEEKGISEFIQQRKTKKVNSTKKSARKVTIKRRVKA
jgi:hypothetical protein